MTYGGFEFDFIVEICFQIIKKYGMLKKQVGITRNYAVKTFYRKIGNVCNVTKNAFLELFSMHYTAVF